MPKSKKSPKKIAAIVLGVILAIIIVAGTGFAYYWNNLGDIAFSGNEKTEIDAETGEEVTVNPWEETKSVNVLILGTDSTDEYDSGRADVVMVFNVNLEYGTINGISIPRDTYVDIPGYGVNKINVAYSYGGVELMTETVESVLGISIDYYATTDFAGFVEVVDLIGGVPYTVESDMYYVTYNQVIDLDAGYQVLDGENSLAYVRYRYYSTGDIERTYNQQAFLHAVADVLLQPLNILKWPQIIPTALEYVDTNMNTTQIIALLQTFAGLDSEDDFLMETIPGWFLDSGWEIDEEDATELVASYFAAIPPQAIPVEEELDTDLTIEN